MANKMLANPGSRHAAGTVIRVGTSGDDGRVSHAAVLFIGPSAGRGRGGEVAVESAPGEGSEFTVTLPGSTGSTGSTNSAG